MVRSLDLVLLILVEVLGPRNIIGPEILQDPSSYAVRNRVEDGWLRKQENLLRDWHCHLGKIVAHTGLVALLPQTEAHPGPLRGLL